MQSLDHVSNAITHARALAEEAETLDDGVTAAQLRVLADGLRETLDAALEAFERTAPMQEGRAMGHRALASFFDEICGRIEEEAPAAAANRILPAGRLDVAERARFVCRRLEHEREGALRALREELERGLLAYETCVDAYLSTARSARALRDAAIGESQLVRVELERAKRRLLARAPVGSEAWRRIKRRAVRTKRPQWRVRGADGPGRPASEAALVARGQLDEGWRKKRAA
jgi:GAF domain-containing protein